MATVGTGLDDSGSQLRSRDDRPWPRANRGPQEAPAATFSVLRRNLPQLRERIGALARRAERLGTSPLALRETGLGDDQHALVVLEGEPPALVGWTLVAIVDHREGEAKLRVVSSRAPALDPRRFRTPGCDHCRLSRRRVETFVVWHAATDRLRQVGTGCLRDFLGTHDPGRLCRQAEYVLRARESLDAAASPRRADDSAGDGVALEAFAAHAAMVLRAQGWPLARARAGDRTDGERRRRAGLAAQRSARAAAR